MTEEEASEILKKLERGESATIKVNGEDITYINLPEPLKPCAEHYFEDAGDEGNGYRAAKCVNCISGRIYDPKEYEIRGGEITKRLS